MNEETESDDESYIFNDDLCVLCQGRPKCPYNNMNIRKAMENAGGCVWCEKIWLDSDGNQQNVIKPGEA